MSAFVEETNADGLTRFYGTQTPHDEKYQVVNIGGGIKQLVVDFSYDDLPGYDADASGGSTPDSFSNNIPFIPAGATVLDAVFIVTTGFTSGTSYEVGFEQQDGTVIDANGVFTTTELAQANIASAGDVRTADGVDVRHTSGTFDNGAVDASNNAYLRVVEAGTFDAGKGRIVLTYVEAAPS